MAAAILEKVLHILPPIVVGNLLPRLENFSVHAPAAILKERTQFFLGHRNNAV